MNFQDSLKLRRSIRSYNGEQVSEADLRLILDAAYLSPIGRGLFDDFQITVVTDPALLNELESAAAASMGAPDAKLLYGAPMQIFVSAPETGTPADLVTMASATCVIQDMSMQAVELGIGNCLVWCVPRAIAHVPELVAKLQVPEGYVPYGSLILGMSDDAYTEREAVQDKIKTVIL